MKKLVVVASLVLTLAACGGPSQRVRVVGAFWEEPEVSITVPSEATAGEPFEVSVSTFGGGCMERGETEVEIRGLEATVTPFDYKTVPASGYFCPLYAEEIIHTTMLTFEQSGTATVTFYAYPDLVNATDLVSVTRTVPVR